MAQTKTADSVKIPRGWFRAASVDLQRGDDYKEELKLLRPKSEAQQQLIYSLKDEVSVAQSRVGELGARLTADSLLQAGMAISHQLQMEALQGQVKQANRRRQLGTFKAVLSGIGAFGIGLLIGRAL